MSQGFICEHAFRVARTNKMLILFSFFSCKGPVLVQPALPVEIQAAVFLLKSSEHNSECMTCPRSQQVSGRSEQCSGHLSSPLGPSISQKPQMVWFQRYPQPGREDLSTLLELYMSLTSAVPLTQLLCLSAITLIVLSWDHSSPRSPGAGWGGLCPTEPCIHGAQLGVASTVGAWHTFEDRTKKE